MSDTSKKSDKNAPRVGLIVNPTAGLGRGRKAGISARKELETLGCTVLDLSGNTAHDALARARAACLEGLDALVVVGGDGMVNIGVNATVHTPTPLAIVASGSGNDFARALKLPVNNPRDSIRGIYRALIEGHEQILDAGLVQPHVPSTSQPKGLTQNPERAREHAILTERWFAGTLSLGLDAAVNLQANAYTWPRGHLKYLRAVVRCLRSYRPYGYCIEFDGEKHDLAGTLAAVSNAPYFGGGIPIAPHASLTDGRLNLMLAQPLAVRAILKIFPKLYKGKHLADPAVSTREITDITIAQGTKGEFPPIAMADGEVMGPVPLRISVQPRVLRVIA